MTLYGMQWIFFFQEKNDIRKVVTCFIDLSRDSDVIKCSDLFNLIASLWHFDESN